MRDAGTGALKPRVREEMTGRSRLGGSHLPGVGSRTFDWLLALRPHQWIKNVVVFAPLVAAHETRLGPYLAALGLFAALSACASGTYLLNDLLDLPYDRTHPRKRHRPLAAGRLPLLPAAGLGVALVALGTVAAFGLSSAAGLCVLGYVLVTSAYSLSLKRRLFVDVAALALLFTMRTVAGAAVGAVTLSSWFLAFAFFVFLALAILKRLSELSGVAGGGAVGTARPRLYVGRSCGAGGAGRGLWSGLGGGVRSLHPESAGTRALWPTGSPVAGGSVAGRLAGTDDSAGRPR